MLITKETYWSHIQHTLASITRAALTAVFAKYIIVWLDLSNVYSSIPHQLITFTFNFYHIPSRIWNLVTNYFNKLLCLLHNSGDLNRLASDEELQLSHPVHSSIHDHDSNWWSEELWEIPVNSATPGPTGVGLPGWCHHPPLDSSLRHQTPEKAWGTANIGPGENKTSKVTRSLNPGRSQERQHLLLSPQWGYEWSLRLPERPPEVKLKFPQEIAATSLRPDMVLWSTSTRTDIMAESTAPWGEGMEAALGKKEGIVHKAGS